MRKLTMVLALAPFGLSACAQAAPPRASSAPPVSMPAMARSVLPAPSSPAVPALAEVPAPPAPPPALAGIAPVPPSHQLPPEVVLSPAQVAAEAASLRTALEREVPRLITLSPEQRQAWITLARAEIARKEARIDGPQILVVVDRNPAVQALMLVLARPSGAWEVLGGAHVSTGQPGRFDHYITPTGVFEHTADILDYRAEGTYNENHVRGLGLKGMRVWDFGWQVASKGWRKDGETGPIRLEMHATDPAVLEARLGRQASSGCVRIPAALNTFLDRHGILDADYEHAAADDPRYRSVLLPDRTPSRLAGQKLVIVDSGAGRT